MITPHRACASVPMWLHAHGLGKLESLFVAELGLRQVPDIFDKLQSVVERIEAISVEDSRRFLMHFEELCFDEEILTSPVSTQ